MSVFVAYHLSLLAGGEEGTGSAATAFYKVVVGASVFNMADLSRVVAEGRQSDEKMVVGPRADPNKYRHKDPPDCLPKAIISLGTAPAFLLASLAVRTLRNASVAQHSHISILKFFAVEL